MAEAMPWDWTEGLPWAQIFGMGGSNFDAALDWVVRAYVTNCVGTSYGIALPFTFPGAT